MERALATMTAVWGVVLVGETALFAGQGTTLPAHNFTRLSTVVTWGIQVLLVLTTIA